MRGSLWLITAVLLLGSIVAKKKYEELHENLKKIVDKAIGKANKDHKHGNHMDYHQIVNINEGISMVHVLLKATSCEKSSDKMFHRTDCSTARDKKPWISCVACGEEMSCLPFKYNKKITENEKCDPNTFTHSGVVTGAAHLLLQAKTDERQVGCLGCI